MAKLDDLSLQHCWRFFLMQNGRIKIEGSERGVAARDVSSKVLNRLNPPSQSSETLRHSLSALGWGAVPLVRPGRSTP